MFHYAHYFAFSGCFGHFLLLPQCPAQVMQIFICIVVGIPVAWQIVTLVTCHRAAKPWRLPRDGTDAR